MPNGRCATARRDYDTALYEKQTDVDSRIRNAQQARELALAGMITAGAAAGASLFSGVFVFGLIGLAAGGYGAWKFHQVYENADRELADARRRCEELLEQAREAFDRMNRYCTGDLMSPEERDRLRAEITSQSCG